MWEVDVPDLRDILKEEFNLTEDQSNMVLTALGDIIEVEETWDTDFFGPDDTRRPKTYFGADGMPIVHSRKVTNYFVNLKKIYKNSELHETALDVLEQSISPHRLLYRILKFAITESKITLSEVQSAVYYLLWVEDLTPVATSKGYELISAALRERFGERVSHDEYQKSLDQLVTLGLINIEADMIVIVELPRASLRHLKDRPRT